MTACVTTPIPTKLTHPALLPNAGLATPPLTPMSPSHHARGRSTSRPAQPLLPSYAMLRSNHASALRYTIAKLRWEQVNGQYILGQDADWNHDQVINKLEKELREVEEAQRGLDRFNICYAPTQILKAHGPHTEEEDKEIQKVDLERERLLEAKLEEQFPFLKKLFIGPMTKQQARNDKLLREQLKEGDFEDVSVLLPSENMRWFMAQQQKKVSAPKRSYQQERYEKEKLKIAKHLEAHPPAVLADRRGSALIGGTAAATAKPRIGPMTKEEWHATLPVHGPQMKEVAMLQVQRAQRAQVIRLLQRPWGEYDERAAGPIEALAALAKERFEGDKKEARAQALAQEEKLAEAKAKKVAEAKEAAEVKKPEAKGTKDDTQDGKKAENSGEKKVIESGDKQDVREKKVELVQNGEKVKKDDKAKRPDAEKGQQRKE